MYKSFIVLSNEKGLQRPRIWELLVQGIGIDFSITGKSKPSSFSNRKKQHVPRRLPGNDGICSTSIAERWKDFSTIGSTNLIKHLEYVKKIKEKLMGGKKIWYFKRCAEDNWSMWLNDRQHFNVFLTWHEHWKYCNEH